VGERQAFSVVQMSSNKNAKEKEVKQPKSQIKKSPQPLGQLGFAYFVQVNVGRTSELPWSRLISCTEGVIIVDEVR
jgi:hypothetical protein